MSLKKQHCFPCVQPETICTDTDDIAANDKHLQEQVRQSMLFHNLPVMGMSEHDAFAKAWKCIAHSDVHILYLQHLLQMYPNLLFAKKADGWTLLHHAVSLVFLQNNFWQCDCGRVKMVHTIIQQQQQLANGESDYMLASPRSNREPVTHDDGASALIIAVQRNHHDVVQEMLQNGDINMNHQDVHGNTALHYACMYGFEQQVHLLVQFKCHINVPNAKGDTAAHVAARNHFPVILHFLEKHGANVQLKNFAQETCTDLQSK